jgi:hypothetical protein
LTIKRVNSIPPEPEKSKGIYELEIDEFIASGYKLARTNLPKEKGKSVSTVHVGLINRARKMKAPILVHLRGNEIFLERK